jgi:hypothetical protein
MAGAFYTVPGAVNPVATLNAYFDVTGVALMVGAAAANAEPEFRKYSDNLADCQRYFVKPGVTWQMTYYATGASQAFQNVWSAPATMRAAPTLIASWSSLGNGTGSSVVSGDNRTIVAVLTSSAAGLLYGNVTITSLDADF